MRLSYQQTLVFHQWVPLRSRLNLRKDPIYYLHLNCLKSLASNIENIVINFSVDNLDNNDQLTEIMDDFLNIFKYKNHIFKLSNNHPLYEVTTFKECILENKYNLKDIVYFAHSKGLLDYNEHHLDLNNVTNWVAFMYYSLFRNTALVDHYIVSGECNLFGACYSNWIGELPKFYGTFYALKVDLISEYYKNDKLPEIKDRCYAEDLVSELIKSDLGIKIRGAYDYFELPQGQWNNSTLECISKSMNYDQVQIQDYCDFLYKVSDPSWNLKLI